MADSQWAGVIMTTKEKLVLALKATNAPQFMIDRANDGAYDDFESRSATPIMDLVRDCQRIGMVGIAERAMQGDFDSTREEARAWMEREGKITIQ